MIHNATEGARRKEGMYIVLLINGKRPILGWWREDRWDALYWGDPYQRKGPFIVSQVIAGPLDPREILKLRDLATGLLEAAEDLYDRVEQEHEADHEDGFTDDPRKTCLTCKVMREHDRLLIRTRKALKP